MKTLIKTRNAISLTVASVALSATLFTAPSIAADNDTYKTIHNGWLSEYQIQPTEVRTASNETYDAVSADNATFATIHNGWLSEFEATDGTGVVAMFDVSRSAAYEGATRKDWLDQSGYRQ